MKRRCLYVPLVRRESKRSDSVNLMMFLNAWNVFDELTAAEEIAKAA
jgi:hypothetical protein